MLGPNREELARAGTSPDAVAFDVVETLITLEPMRDRFVEIGLLASTLEFWVALMLRDEMALSLAGATNRSRSSRRPRCA